MERVIVTIKGGKGVWMTQIHTRLVHLPPTCTKKSLNHMEATDVSKIWKVQGTVDSDPQVQMCNLIVLIGVLGRMDVAVALL